MSGFTKLSVFAITASVVSAAAYGNDGTENDALMITKASVPIAQAISVAEQHVNGKASRAEFEHSKQGWVYDVEVVSGTKVFDVHVDANKGTIISSTEDKIDHDDRHDKDD